MLCLQLAPAWGFVAHTRDCGAEPDPALQGSQWGRGAGQERLWGVEFCRFGSAITPGVRRGAVPSPCSVLRLYVGLACHLTELPSGQCPGVPRTSPQGVQCPALCPGPCLSALLEP